MTSQAGKEPGMDSKMLLRTGQEKQANREISVKSGKDRVSTPRVWSYTGWDSKKKKHLQKSTLAFNGGWNSQNHQFWRFPEFHPVFLSFFSWAPPLPLRKTFTAPTCTATIIPLEPCPLNAEISPFRIEFQHFILRFLYFTDTTNHFALSFSISYRDFFTLRIPLTISHWVSAFHTISLLYGYH